MTCKLTYFEVKGKGEPIRMLLHAVGQEFEDHRIKKEEWPALKETLPSKQLPIFYTPDGKVMRESLAICRHIALKYGLYSTDPETLYRIELVIGILTDLHENITKFFHMKDKDVIQQETKAFREINGPRLLNQLQEILDNSTTGYLADIKPTLADIIFVSKIDLLEGKHDVLLDQYPKLVQHKDKVIAFFPKLSEYMKTRPTALF